MYKDLYIKATSGSPAPPIDDDLDSHFAIVTNSAGMNTLENWIGFISRLNTDGTKDDDFDSRAGLDSQPFAVTVQSDDKVIYVGNFTNVGNRIVRMNTSGSVDTTFNAGNGGLNSTPTFVTTQPSDGKILVGGNFTNYSGSAVNRIVRINTDGTRDTSFNIGTGFNDTGGTFDSISVQTITFQSDDKIIVGGNFTSYSGSSINRIIRLETDGTIDTSFNVGTGFNGGVLTTAIQSDDKIIAGGSFGLYSGSAINRIARLNTDGTLDTTFNIGPTGFNNTISTIAIQSDGKVLVGGNFTLLNSGLINRLARLNTDGTQDTAFRDNWNIFYNSYIVPLFGGISINDIKIQSDGKILIGNNTEKIYRLNTDGTLDTTFFTFFNSGGAITRNGLALTSTDKIYISSTISRYKRDISYGGTNGLITFNKNGGINLKYVFMNINGDNFRGEFNYNTKELFIFTSNNFPTRSPINPLGQNYSYLHKFKDGKLDNYFSKNLWIGFTPNASSNSGISSITFQSDNKILACGSFTGFNGNTRNRFLRLNNDGTEDTSFNNNLGTGFNVAIFTRPAIQSDGKILVGDNFTSFNGNTRNRLVRINSDGTEDTAFYTNLGTGFNVAINAVVLQSDGKILVGGAFTTLNGTTRNRLVRLNTDGTLDSTFSTNLGTAFNAIVRTIVLQSDGKILVGGEFTTLNGITRNRLVRLNTDGTQDTTFNDNLGTGFSISGTTPRADVIVLQSDGKILVSGLYNTFNGNPRTFVRLNTDGTEDATFATNLGTGPAGNPVAIRFQSDGKILIGGPFETINGFICRRIARLEADGTLDLSYKGTAISSFTSFSVNNIIVLN
jgi:uncharacterized delta-60 repeat protein